MLQFVIKKPRCRLWCRQWSSRQLVEFEILTMNGNGLSNLRPSLSVWRNYILILTHDETCQPLLSSPATLHCQVTTKMCKGVSGCSHRGILSNNLLTKSNRESSLVLLLSEVSTYFSSD